MTKTEPVKECECEGQSQGIHTIECRPETDEDCWHCFCQNYNRTDGKLVLWCCKCNKKYRADCSYESS